jgi:hypothetical protein
MPAELNSLSRCDHAVAAGFDRRMSPAKNVRVKISFSTRHCGKISSIKAGKKRHGQ